MARSLHLWLVLAIGACSASDGGFNQNPALHPRFYHLDWMKRVPDGTPVSAVAVPGTHESLSEYGGPLSQRQVWNLNLQLKAGVRYLDLHVGIWMPEQQHVYVWDGWWMISQQIRMDEVLVILFNFLELHRSETVLLNVQVHGLYKSRVVQMIRKTMSHNRDRIWSHRAVPTMGQARGKLVLLRSGTLEGVDKSPSFFFWDNKLDYVECKIEQVRPQLCGGSVVVTENPRAGLWTPRALARTVNAEINKCVAQNRRSANQGCLGVISMDFPSAALVHSIIQLSPCRCAPEPEPTTEGPLTTAQTTPPATEPGPEEPTPPATEPCPEEPPPSGPAIKPPPPPPPTEPHPEEPPPGETDTEPPPPPPTFEPGPGSEPAPLTEPSQEEPPGSGSGLEPGPEPGLLEQTSVSSEAAPADGGSLLTSPQEPTWSSPGAPP